MRQHEAEVLDFEQKFSERQFGERCECHWLRRTFGEHTLAQVPCPGQTCAI